MWERIKDMEFSKYFDHTILKADASEEDVDVICEEAIQYNFASSKPFFTTLSA